MNRQQREDFWDRLWADEGNHDFWKKVSPDVLELVRRQEPDRRPDVLDLGCGLGRNAIAFAAAGFHVTATDLSTTAVTQLQEWAGRRGLQIRAFACDFVDNVFGAESFDIIVSINVIYHGYRAQAVRAIGNVFSWLRPRGVLYFTFPSREDGEYGKGKELAPHTFELAPGHLHYHADAEDLKRMLYGFRVLKQTKHEHHWERGGVPQLSSRWRVLATKP